MLASDTWRFNAALKGYHVANNLPVKNPVASSRPFTHNPSSSMLIHGLFFTPALLRSLLTGKVSLHWCPMRNSLKKRGMLHSLWRTTLARYWSDNSLPRWRLQLRFAPTYSWALPRGKYLPATQASHVFFTNLISFSTQLFTWFIVYRLLFTLQLFQQIKILIVQPT